MKFLGQFFSFVAALIAVLTVAGLPWLLGGLVPDARLLLLVGAVCASVISLLANLLQWKQPAAIPLIVVPLAGLVLLGTWQLRPVEQHPVFQITHAETQPPDDLHAVGWQASISPADTRTVVSSLLAGCLLASVAFDQLRSRRALAMAGTVLVANAIAVTGLGLSELVSETHFALNDIWQLTNKDPFATFVNPNNAAGWICLGFAVAAGWLVYQSRVSGYSDDGHRSVHIPWHIRIQQNAVGFVADLTTGRVVAFCMVIFLAAGVAATQSRGGILALVTGVTITSLLAARVKRLPLVLALVVGGAVATFWLLNTLDLGAGVVQELQTLEDLDEAAGSRPRHWKDSLRALLDFPIFGTGLGSYRYSSLPYQSEHTALWFQNADNHFVDMAVEGGLPGLLLFIAVGLSGLLAGRAGWKLAQQKLHRNRVIYSRRLCRALGTTVMLAVLTQAASGFLDYGVAMPAAMSLLVLLVAAATAYFHELQPDEHIWSKAAVPIHPAVAVSLQLCLLSAAIVYLPDQAAAQDLYGSVVAGRRLLEYPVTPDELDQLPETRTTLHQKLRRRQDDPSGLRVLSRLADAEFRWSVMRAEGGDTIRNDPGFEMVWNRYTAMLFARRLAAIAETDAAMAATIRQRLRTICENAGVPAVLQQLQGRFPLMPTVSELRAELAVLFDDDDLFAQQVRQGTFVEPANATTHIRLGLLAVDADQPQEAIELWQRAAMLQPSARSVVLEQAQRRWSVAEAFHLFGPTTYAESVLTAESSRSASLKKLLYDQAESFWERNIDAPDVALAGLRGRHLQATGRLTEAIEFLQQQIEQQEQVVPLRRRLAVYLEEAGRFSDSLDEWHAIRYLSPRDRAAAEDAIARLKAMK